MTDSTQCSDQDVTPKYLMIRGALEAIPGLSGIRADDVLSIDSTGLLIRWPSFVELVHDVDSRKVTCEYWQGQVHCTYEINDLIITSILSFK